MNYTQYENEYTNDQLDNSYFYSGEQIPYEDEQVTMEQLKREYYDEQRQMDFELEVQMNQEYIYTEKQTLGEWLKQDDKQFKKEVEQYNKIQAKLDREREARKPTEAEIQQAQQEFLGMCRQDKLNQQKQDARYEKWLEEHYNSHPHTSIKLDDPLNVQIRKMLVEIDQERKQEAEKQRKLAIKRSNEIMYNQHIIIRNKNSKRHKQNKPNAKGKFQGVKKQEEKKSKGSRAGRREKKQIGVEIVASKTSSIIVQDFIKEEVESEVEEGEEEMKVEEIKENKEEKIYPLANKSIFNLKETTKIRKIKKQSIPQRVTKRVTNVLSIVVGKSYKEEKKAEKATHNTTKTVMCKSVTNNKKCYHGKSCRFAHSINELNAPECRFGNRCKYYQTCKFIHTDSETKEQYLIRLGVIKPKQSTKQPTKQYKAPVAPWANKTTKALESKPCNQKPRKSRWDQKPRKSRWDN